MTNKLNYDNAAALINAFKQGAKFKIIECKFGGSVIGMRPHGSGVCVTTAAGNTMYNPDGSRYYPTYPGRLIRDESLGFERTTVTVGDSVFGWTGKRGEGAAAATPAAPVAEKPLLQRLLSGETFHNPKTRETLDSFHFSRGTLVVSLKGEDGKLRTSERYDHNGKHKWRPERSLVAGPVPPKAPVVPEFTAEELRAGKVDEGVYKPVDASDAVRVIVCGNFPENRVAVFVGHIFPCAIYNNDRRKYVKTAEKPSAVLARIGS